MANDDFNWGGIFDRPEEEEEAIPDMSPKPISGTPKAPTQAPSTPQQSYDWGSVFTPLSKSPALKQAIPEEPGESHILKGAWELAKQVPSIITDVVPLTVARTIRGGLRGGNNDLDPNDWLDSWIEENKAERERRTQMLPGVGEMTWFRMPFTGDDVKIGDTTAIADSLGYSIVNAITAQIAKVGFGLLGTALSGGNPVVGRIAGLVGGFGAGVAVSGLATKDQFIDDIQNIFLKAHKATEITPDLEAQWNSIFNEIQGDANMIGFWEAGPETLGNMLTWGIANAGKGKITKAMFAKLKEKMVKKITSQIGAAAVKAATKVGVGAGKLGAAWTEEALTETLTAKMQNKYNVKHGLEDKIMTWEDAFTEVLPMVFVTTPLMLGGAKVAGMAGNVLSDANPDVPKKAPGKVTSKVDADTVLEIAGARMIKEHLAEVEATQIVTDKLLAEEGQAIPDPSDQSAQAMGGITTQPGVALEDDIVDKIADTLIDKDATEDLDVIGPTYRERIDAGELTETEARALHEEEFMAKPEGRPEWASTVEQISEPLTDADLGRQTDLRKEARTAFEKTMGKDVTTESEPVAQYKDFLQKEGVKGGVDYSKKYGKDFVKQVSDKKLNPVQRLWKQVTRVFYGRDVFYVEYNKAVNDDPNNKLSIKKGARIAKSGAIIIVKGDPIRNTSTLFHELTHDMNRTAPEIWKKLYQFLIDNVDDASIKTQIKELKKNYVDSKSIQADELVSIFIGDLMTKGKAQVALLKKLSLQDPTTFEKLMRYIQDVLAKLRAFLIKSDEKAARLLVKDVNAAIDFVTTELANFQKVSRTSQVGKTKKEMRLSTGLTFDIEKKGKQEVKYYSEMNRYLEGALPGKGGAKQYTALINKWDEKGSFKTEELEWAGLIEWLNDPETLKTINATDEWKMLINRREQATMYENVESIDKTNKRLTELPDPVPATVFTKKNIMDYLKENEVSIVEIHKVELSKMADFDLPQADEDRRRLVLKIQNAIPSEPITLQMEHGTDTYDGFEINSTGEQVLFSSAYDAFINMGASEIYAENMVSDIDTLLSIDAEIKNVQEIADPEGAKKLWEKRLIDLQTTLKDDHKMAVRVEDIDPEGRWGETGNLQVDSIVNTDNGQEVEVEDDHPANIIIESINESLDKIYKFSKMDALIPTQYGPAAASSLNIGGGRDYMEMLLTLPKVTPKFLHGHWKDTENVVAMVRFDFRIVDGKKVLLIQELQSDWHQKGRKWGYGPQYKAVLAADGMWEAINAKGEVLVGPYEGQLTRYTTEKAVQDAIDARPDVKYDDGRVPDAPYKKSWSDLVMKRMVKMAAELGQDYLAWVPAEVIKDRYNLSNVLDQVLYEPDIQTFFAYDKEGSEVMNEPAETEADIAEFIGEELASRLWGEVDNFEHMKTQYEVAQDDNGAWNIFDPNGEIMYDTTGEIIAFEEKRYAEKRLERIFTDEMDRNPIVLRGVDLEVGGEWAVNLYDKKLKNRANKLFGKKAWGKPKVFKDKIPTSDYPDIEFYIKVNGKDPTVAGSDLMNHEIPRADKKLIEYLIEMKGEDIETMHDEWVAGPRTIEGDDNVDSAIENWLMGAVHASEQDNFNLEYGSVEQDVWLLPITQKMKDKIPGTETMTFDIEEAPAKGKGDRSALNMINNIMAGTDGLMIEKDDYGTQAIAEGMGYTKEGDTYKFDERIPKHVDIIAGMYQASWYVDLETKRSTEKLYGKIPKQVGQPEGETVGPGEQGKDQIKLEKYLNQSWGTYRDAADSTDKGDFLPVKNVLLRPKGIGSGKGRQLLIQISSDFKSEGSSNIGDSYYEALYNKREGYLRPSNDFWELPEWMNRMTYFLPDADIYVIRNLKEAKLFLNQAGYDNVFFSVLDITKKFVKEVADTYTGKIIAGGYLPDGSYYKGMKNVTWVGDMKEAAEKLGVEFKNGVDYRYFKNTKTIPRLEMSKGCLHKCAFCSQDRFLTVSSPEDIKQQIAAYKSFDYEIVYLNDKTFGQSENFPDLIGIKEDIKKVNPNFKGFVIQTTATQYLKMSDEFLTNAGIVYLEIGVETFNDKMLGLLSKPHREKHILEAAAKARRLNQVLVPNVMVGLASREKAGKVYYRGSKVKELKRKQGRGAFYFTTDKGFAEDWGDVTEHNLSIEKTWDYKNQEDFDIANEALKATKGYQPYMSEELKAGDWGELEKPAVRKALRTAGYDSYKTFEAGETTTAVFDKAKITDVKAGSIFVETEATYARTLKFLNDNKDVISHLNIGVLAAESGTKLHQQLDAVESDQDEFHTERTWLKNVDIHEKFFADLSAFGEQQLDSKEITAYVKESIEINLNPVDTVEKPVEAYHGTFTDFDEFKKGDIGFHFGTKDQANARIYFEEGVDLAPDGEGRRIIPVRIKIKRPLRLDDAIKWGNVTNIEKMLIKKGLISEAGAKKLRSLSDVRDFIKGLGYDGIVYENLIEGTEAGDSYIAFDSDQVEFALLSTDTVTEDVESLDHVPTYKPSNYYFETERGTTTSFTVEAWNKRQALQILDDIVNEKFDKRRVYPKGITSYDIKSIKRSGGAFKQTAHWTSKTFSKHVKHLKYEYPEPVTVTEDVEEVDTKRLAQFKTEATYNLDKGRLYLAGFVGEMDLPTLKAAKEWALQQSKNTQWYLNEMLDDSIRVTARGTGSVKDRAKRLFRSAGISVKGKVYEGVSHLSIMNEFPIVRDTISELSIEEIDTQVISGFVQHDGTFTDREQATKMVGEGVHRDGLGSEDFLKIEKVKEPDMMFTLFRNMMPAGIRLDAIGEEGTTTPVGMLQVTVTDKESPAAGGTFNIKAGNIEVIAKDVARAIDEYVELRKGVLKDLRDRMTEDIEGPVVEGDRQSTTFRNAYYGIFELAKKAKGMKNVRSYLMKNKKLGDEPVTEELIKNIGNVADRFYKDKKKANAFKKVVKMREDLATGRKLASDPKVIKEMEKIPNLQPYTIRYTAPNYAIGMRMRYGKFIASDALFDADREITRETALKFRNPITGNMESVTKQYDKEGNRLISGPIFSTDRQTRLKEIKKIVLKNKRYSTWYEDWKKFMFQFVSNDMSEMKIKRIAAISGMLGAGKSPQTQQQLWAETINSLESGHRPTKVAKNELEKMMEIWEGKRDDVLSRTDDEGIQLIQEEFGRKIGPYLAAAIDPSSPNVLVLDRHMPKGWGYNVLASSSSPQGGWNMHPSVESEVRRDILEVADDMGVTVAGVQAALWFDFRTPAADQSDIAKIAQIEPSRYVPSVFHKTTDPEVTLGIHYKKTDIPEGEFVRGASVKGDIKFNTYSQTDIGERIARATKDWPYQSAVYMYQPGMTQEAPIRTGRRAYTFKYDPRTIYDGVNDPYNYWGTAKDELKKSPQSSLTNIFLKLVSTRQQYQGAIVRSPYKPQEDQWMLMFDRAEVTDFPEITNVGISDMIDDIDTTYSDFESAVKDMAVRGQDFAAFTKSVRNQKKYNELTFDRHYPSVARFEGVTSGEIELGLGLKLDGPLRSQRAYLAEIGIARNQRYIYLAHSPRSPANYPDFTDFSDAKLFSFKAKDKYNENIIELAKGLEAAGLKDFNIVASPAGWSIIEQITFNDKNAAQMADIIEKFADKGHPHNDVRDIHSETLGGDTMEEALVNYSSAIIDYWGEKKGREIIDGAIKEGKSFEGQVREGTYQKRIDDRTRGKKPGEDKGIQDDLGVTEDVEDQLERIGRTKVSTVEKVRRSAQYEKGTFTTASSDRLHPLKMAAGEESKAYMMHRGLPGIQSSINAMMEHGILELEDSGVLTTETRKEGFIPWLRKLGKDGEKFFYWLIVKRDQSRQERDKKYTPMFTQEERDKLFEWTGDTTKAGKNWQEVNKEFQVFNDSILKIGIKSGLLDPAMVAQFRDQFYIPFYRIFEDAQATAEFIKAPVNTKKLISAQIKKLQGSKRQMGDPLENIMTNWAHLLKQSMTNMSRKEAFEILVANEAVNEMGEPIVEEVPWKDTVIFKPGGKRMNDYGGADTVTFVYQKDNVEVLGFKDNGKTRFFKVNDAELFNAMSLQNTKTLPKWLSMILGAPKALLTFGATVTPGFVVANTLRDTLHTYTIADGFIPFISTAKGFYKTLIKDQDYVEYMASGNSFVGSYVKAESAEEFNKYTKKIIAKEGRSVLKRILTSPAQLWNFWRTITEASENAARLELYALKKRQGATKLEASFAARDIMDFQKKGASAVVQYLTLTVPFLNARIQGLVKMGQAAAARPGMYALKGATVAIASLALWAAYKDDDRYKELEAWEKFAYYHFWIGDKHFRIPKPFETGVIWSSAFTAAADVAVKNEEADHIMSFIGTAMMDTFAFNPVPQAARPLLEQYMNKNFFTGRPIVSESLKYRKPADRYSPWDHESMIALGKLLNVSPKRAQSLVRGYLAGLGTGIMSGADIMVRQFGDFPARPESTIDSYPMIGRFVRSTPSRYTKFQSSFYEVFNQLNELNQTIRIAQRDGRFVEADELRKLNNKKMIAFGKGKIVKNRLAFISKKMNNIWLSKSMDPKRKRLEINKLTIERNEIVKDFYTWYLSNK